MKSRGIFVALLLASAALLALLCRDSSFFVGTDSFSTGLSLPERSWAPLLQLTSNAFLSWRSDPWILTIAAGIGDASSPVAYQLASLFIFASGLFVFLKVTRLETLHAASATLLSTLLLAAITGADTVTLGVIAWIPWLSATILAARHGGEFYILIPYLLLALRACTTANHGVALTFLGAAALVGIGRAPTDTSKMRQSLLMLMLISTIGGYFWFLYTDQQASFPTYPATARIVPDDEIAGTTRPLLGPDQLIAVINRKAVKEESRELGFLIACFGAILAVFASFRRDGLALRFARASSILGLAIVWDSARIESFAQVGPLAALSRMVPNLFLFPLAPLASACAMPLLVLAMAQLIRTRRILPLVTVAAVALTIGWHMLRTASIQTGSVAFGIEAEDLSAPEWTKSSPHVPGYESLDWTNALLSPSRFVARFYGRSNLAMSYSPNFTTPTPIAPFLRRIQSSRNERQLRRLSDGKLGTRYTTGPGGQTGDEVLTVWLNNPVEIIGVSLAVGQFTTDFPRGVEIRGDLNCSEETIDESANWPLLASFPSWQGPPKRTEDRFPYFGGEEDVRVPLRAPTTVGCLRISQTGKSAFFDWSIAELGLLLGRES